MSSDLKIEIFAYNIFRGLWYTFKVTNTVPNIFEFYGEECNKVKDYKEAFDKRFCSVILVRHSIFKNMYRSYFTDEKVESFKSPFHCYDYIFRKCDRVDLFGNMTVFEKMFASITFVFIVCFRMHQIDHVIDIIKYGYVFWVTYFENFIQEFYEKGGWKKLKMEAETYDYLFEFDDLFNKCMFNLQAIKQATTNYLRFKNTVDYKERKSENQEHISKISIQSRTKHFNKYIRTPLSYEIFLNAFEAELLLKDLKQAFPSSRCNNENIVISKEKHQESNISTEMSYSEVNHTSEEIKNTDVDGIQPFISERESSVRDKIPDDFPNIDTDLVKEVGIKVPISEQEVSKFDIAKKNENLEIDKITCTEMDSLQISSSNDSVENLHIEHYLLPVVNINTQPESSIKNITQVTDLDHGIGSKFFLNKDEDGTIENVSIGNIEEQDKIRVTNPVISINKTDEKISSEKVSAVKDLSSENENVASYNKSINITKARENLRKERKDSEMKNFLKMLLVLDSNEEAKYVLSTIQNDTVIPENSQENLNRQKKKSKKKKSKK